MDKKTNTRPSPLAWVLAVAMTMIGVGWQYGSLYLIERQVTEFPSIPDVLMDALPRVDFGAIGEFWFFALILLFAIPHFQRYRQNTPKVIATIGLYYFVRGLFMYFFPIGAPVGAALADDRISIWGFESHAYFPGGHIGILTILAMNMEAVVIRRALWIGLIVFGLGTLLSKTHYTMDSVAGMIIGYAVALWVDRRWNEHRSALTQSGEVRRIV